MGLSALVLTLLGSLGVQMINLQPDLTLLGQRYTGMGGASGGVLGMLEVIASDFARLETDTAMQEEQAAAEYKKFTNEAAVDRARKTQDISNKNKLSTKKSAELQQTKSDLKGTQGELNAALEYYDKLKPSCVDAGDRKSVV